jgi:hypothetical protein
MSGQFPNWLKPVENKLDYIAALRAAISVMHQCWAVWVKTEHVHETFQGKTVWNGDVEVFSLMHHPKAQRCYAWAHLEGKNDQETRYVAVLESPPVKDAKTAVQASIMADSQKHKP